MRYTAELVFADEQSLSIGVFMASIARKNLFEDVPRLLVAQAGIMFAVSLVTIQTGILNGFTRSTGLLIDRSKADIWLASNEMVYLELTLPLPVEYLLQARRVPGVAKAEALLFTPKRWRVPPNHIAPNQIVGFDPDGELFAPWNFTEGDVKVLRQPYTVIVDESTTDSLAVEKVGDVGSINNIPTTIGGFVRGNQSIASSIFMFASLESANTYATSQIATSIRCQSKDGTIECVNEFSRAEEETGDLPDPKSLSASDFITYILVKAEPGQDLEELKQRLEASIPDTRAYAKEEMARITRQYWQQRTGIGFILGLGAAVGTIVGMVVVGQILYASVADNLKEFATLKAMGASNGTLYRVIVEQALWMAVMGYIPGMLLCLGVSSYTSQMGILISITPATGVAVFGITLVICIGASLFAIQRVTKIDPAIVFKA